VFNQYKPGDARDGKLVEMGWHVHPLFDSSVAEALRLAGLELTNAGRPQREGEGSVLIAGLPVRRTVRIDGLRRRSRWNLFALNSSLFCTSVTQQVSWVWVFVSWSR